MAKYMHTTYLDALSTVQFNFSVFKRTFKVGKIRISSKFQFGIVDKYIRLTVLFIFLSPPIKELCSKMAPGEVGVSLP